MVGVGRVHRIYGVHGRFKKWLRVSIYCGSGYWYKRIWLKHSLVGRELILELYVFRG